MHAASGFTAEEQVKGGAGAGRLGKEVQSRMKGRDVRKRWRRGHVAAVAGQARRSSSLWVLNLGGVASAVTAAQPYLTSCMWYRDPEKTRLWD